MDGISPKIQKPRGWNKNVLAGKILHNKLKGERLGTKE